MIIVKDSTMVIVHACTTWTMIAVLASTVTRVHTCTVIIVHACTMIILLACRGAEPWQSKRFCKATSLPVVSRKKRCGENVFKHVRLKC